MLIIAALVAGLVVEVGFQVQRPGPEGGSFDVVGGFAYMEEPSIEVKYAGLEPRSELRYRPTAGKQEFRLTLWNETSGGSSALGIEAETQVDLQIRGQIKDVLEDGSFTWRWKVLEATVVNAEVEGELIAPEQADLLSGLKGLKGWSQLDDRGFVLRSVLQGGGRGASEELRHGLAQVLQEPMVHLPQEPIGDRAVWSVHRRDLREGADVSAVDRFEIADLDDEFVRVTVRSKETAETQIVAEGRFLNLLSMSTELVAHRGKGGGKWTFGLQGQLAVSGEGWLDRTSDLIVGLSGLESQLVLTSRSETAIDAP